MEVGVLSSPRKDGSNPFTVIAEYGVTNTQYCNWSTAYWTCENAQKAKADAAAVGVRISAVWAGYTGPAVWNFIDGPQTLGLVPAEFREQRVKELKQGADFAAWCGAPAIITHCGFIPENPKDALYAPTLAAIVEVGKHCKQLGLGFWFETGQETPVVLLRVIEDSGLDNLGVNLDTANLVLYGKGNATDSLDVFGKHVRGLHAKDGFYPTNGRELGRQVAIGEGKVDFPKVIAGLHQLGYAGDVTIEREISGPQQAADIKKSVTYLRRLIKSAEKKRPVQAG
ncbi:MAG: xylose isomerase [Lentisphaerae bacterium RIFOXYB12_FULL_65_16]|nr:MAG: xylose isomerase [Lentisphaerae bacterium RIFOXYA12_64_32]OGV89343.1 MAG: xylose isomerase [Lentisphaerae bacterium RIFOXYB12_FULL_65_16]